VELGAGVQVASGAVIVSSVPDEHAVKRRVETMTTVPLRRGGAVVTRGASSPLRE
jgi:serine acetyltransferase